MSRLALLVLCALAAPVATAADLPDPTRPSWAQPAPQGNATPRQTVFRLESVLISAERRVAVINGTVVQEGELVDGAAVLRIEPGIVTLRRAGRKLVLTLLPDSVKQTS